jgi:protein-disulfide isomerase
MPVNTAAKLVMPVGPRDHIEGPPTAPVTLVEYGDYECRHCGAAHSIVQELQQLLGDELRFVFRHFPLTNIHPRAEGAAEAAEAAGVQGRFWQMHHLLFENQDALDMLHIMQFAEALGLDQARFAHEIDTGLHRERVREDFMSGVRSGVNGTPTFFINGFRHDGGWQLNSLLYAIEHAPLPVLD